MPHNSDSMRCAIPAASTNKNLNSKGLGVFIGSWIWNEAAEQVQL
jgi:hypothetical protein